MPRLSEAVKRDQARITDAYHGLMATDPDDRQPDAFVWALARYLIVENLALLPALEYHLSSSGERRRRLSDDYDSIHTKLRHMVKYDPSEESFVSALRAIWVDLEPHIREENDGDLDELESKMGAEDSEALGKKYETLRDMLQKPYGKDGVPDEETLKDVLDTTKQELMERLGMGGA
ncbi:hypothetical protein QBC44DRAFT_314409 [Cladorrhinum sp. PSN332]|nr:hypothetical protein QBC44DRAFT_314409 [Cladorrhinum sp. PSN332]